MDRISVTVMCDDGGMTKRTDPTQCTHRWRYSSERDIFFCMYCFTIEQVDGE